MSRPKSTMIDLVPEYGSSQSVSLQDPRQKKSRSRRKGGKNLQDKDDDRPLSVFMMPPSTGDRKSNQQQLTPPESVVSVASAPKPAVNRKPSSNLSQPQGQSQQKAAERRATAETTSKNNINSGGNQAAALTITPKSMTEAMAQFEDAKKNASQRFKHNMSSTSRLINALADLTVLLLTRAMNEGTDDYVDLRVYKKPATLGNGGYAVAEYRGVAFEPEKPNPTKKEAPTGEQTSDSDYNIICSGELLAGAEGDLRDNVENWRSFFGVVKSLGLWWRYCYAVHKRIGWKVKLERSMLNMIDGRVLGYVTVRISNFV